MYDRYFTRFGGAALGLGLLLASTPARAQLTTFASVLTGADALQFLNNGASSTYKTTSGSAIPVVFRYSVANGTSLVNTDIAATMTISAGVTGGAGGFFQSMNAANMVISANAAINGKTNLLTLSTSTGTLTKSSGSTATFAGTQGGIGGTDIVTFSSDFLSFVGTTVRDFTITNNSISPGLTINGNGFMDTWTGTGSGLFASNPVPQISSSAPEPTTLALLVLGGFGIALRRRH